MMGSGSLQVIRVTWIQCTYLSVENDSPSIYVPIYNTYAPIYSTYAMHCLLTRSLGCHPLDLRGLDACYLLAIPFVSPSRVSRTEPRAIPGELPGLDQVCLPCNHRGHVDSLEAVQALFIAIQLTPCRWDHNHSGGGTAEVFEEVPGKCPRLK